MLSLKLCVFVILCLVSNEQAARIFVVSVLPSRSHQIIIRSIVGELLKRNHELVVLTSDPAYAKGKSPANLTEIDVQEVSYSYIRDRLLDDWIKKKNALEVVHEWFKCCSMIFEKQLKTRAVQQFIKNKRQHFDLIILDGTFKPVLVWTHVFKAPVILVHPTVATDSINHIIGAVTHPMLYPQFFTAKLGDLTIWEKIKTIYFTYKLYEMDEQFVEKNNKMLKQIFGPETPAVYELQNNVDMLFYCGTPIWDNNRPVPPNVIYVGGLHLVPERPLPEKILADLEDSPQDVIYVSFGTNVNTSALPPHTLQVMCKVFAALPYKIYWKWEPSKYFELPKNIKTFKWLPQADLLRHPKVKLFITHAGLRSTEEAIDAGVPIIGMPVALDQFLNAENYVKHGIGIKINIQTFTETQLTEAIKMIMRNQSYRQNILRLRTIMYDQPMKPLERAVWWTEYVLRHGGSRHLRSPAANMSWAKFFELKLVLVVFTVIVAVFISFLILICLVFKIIRRRGSKEKVKMF